MFWQWITFCFKATFAPLAMGLGGSVCHAWGASKAPKFKQIMVDLPAQLPKTQVILSTLDLS